MRIFLISTLIFLIISCKKDDDNQTILTSSLSNVSSLSDIPDGETSVINDADFTGKGAQTNLYNTTVLVDGTVLMDDLTVNGVLKVSEGDTLIVNGTLQVSGGGELLVDGVLITDNFTQIGKAQLTGANVTVNGKYTISGGVNLQLSNAYLEVNELVIIGNISADNSSKYSLINSIETKYFNRAGGTKICGSVLFTTSNNQGTYQEVPTQYALLENESLPVLYKSNLYRYIDNCQ